MDDAERNVMKELMGPIPVVAFGGKLDFADHSFIGPQLFGHPETRNPFSVPHCVGASFLRRNTYSVLFLDTVSARE